MDLSSGIPCVTGPSERALTTCCTACCTPTTALVRLEVTSPPADRRGASRRRQTSAGRRPVPSCPWVQSRAEPCRAARHWHHLEGQGGTRCGTCGESKGGQGARVPHLPAALSVFTEGGVAGGVPSAGGVAGVGLLARASSSSPATAADDKSTAQSCVPTQAAALHSQPPSSPTHTRSAPHTPGSQL